MWQASPTSATRPLHIRLGHALVHLVQGAVADTDSHRGYAVKVLQALLDVGIVQVEGIVVTT